MKKKRTPSESRRTQVRKSNARARSTTVRVPNPARQQARTAKAKLAFIRLFAVTGNVLRSCQAAKMGRRTVYDWLAEDDAFKALYDIAHDEALDALEEEARRRAVVGVLEPVYQGGAKVGSIRKYSDTLLITLLKGKRPETFRERFEHTGKDGAPIEHSIKNAKSTLLDKLQQLADRASRPADDVKKDRS